MKKNNPRKPFFNQEGEDSSSSRPFKKGDSFSKGPKFGSKDGDFDSRKKSFGKSDERPSKSSFGKRSEDKPAFGKRFDDKPSYGKRNEERPSQGGRFEGKPSFGDKPKGKFFKEGDSRDSKPAFEKRFDAEEGVRKPFGEKRFGKDGGDFKKKFTPREEGSGFKKPYGDKPDRFRKDESGPKKFEKRDDFKKPFQKDFKDESFPRKEEGKLVYKGRGRDQKPIYEVEKPKYGEQKPAEKRGFGKNRPKKFEVDLERPEYNFDNIPQKKAASEDGMIRLNKYIANSGICSRREADELISSGQVTVNGTVIKEMGYKVKKSDRVVFEGKRINPEKPVYVLLNKPKDFITTTDDPMERKTVMKLVENACEERIFPVGRLDRNTTGLLLFTNDGELAAKLSHPSNEIKKIYQVTLDNPLTKKDEEAILEGITLEDGEAKVDDMQVLSADRKILGLEIHIGRNRIVRRIFAHFGYEVVGLDRVMYAGLDKKDLKRGHYRFLSEKEVIRLKYYT